LCLFLYHLAGTTQTEGAQEPLAENNGQGGGNNGQANVNVSAVALLPGISPSAPIEYESPPPYFSSHEFSHSTPRGALNLHRAGKDFTRKIRLLRPM